MKRSILIALAVTLIAGLVGGAAIAAKKPKAKKRPRPVDQSFFLRRDDCGSSNDNARLSIEDAPDSPCWYIDQIGVVADAIVAADEAGAPFNSGALWDVYPAADGVPLTLNAKKPIGGEVTLTGGKCLDRDACAPQSLAAGEVTVTYRVVGEVTGQDEEEEEVEEIELGAFEETFDIGPNESHTSTIEIDIDDALHKTVLTGLSLEIYRGGVAYGPGVISYDDPASFLVVPTLAKGRAAIPTPTPSPSATE